MDESLIPEGYEVVNVPLREIRFKQGRVGRREYPDGRVTDFYEAEADQFVCSYGEAGFEWRPIAGFSVHRGCEVVIVNLANGSQIITDHDPRAVFGIDPLDETLTLSRFYPDEALNKGVLIPFAPESGLSLGGAIREFAGIEAALDYKADLLGDRSNSRISYSKDERCWRVSPWTYDPTFRFPAHQDRRSRYGLESEEDCRDFARLLRQEDPENYESSTAKRWRALFETSVNGGVSWTRVVSADYTGVAETGYDLTVPGYETFMAADGIILSNTLNLHVPSTPEAVRESKEILLPSKMLFSIRDQDKVVPALKHEQVLGLFTANARASKETFDFPTREEAIKAVQSRQVPMSSEVTVMGSSVF